MDERSTIAFRITAPYFCAGIVCDSKGWCIEAAPILRWCEGKHYRRLREYFLRKRWTIDNCGWRSNEIHR